MTAEKYVRDITQKIRCSKKKRMEIKQQLLSDISAALENGEGLEEVLKRMGSVKEVVKEFNQNLSEQEEKAYRKGKRRSIFLGALLAVMVLIAVGYWYLPKTALLEESVFKKEIVEEQVKQVIQELDQYQFDLLKEHAIEEMQEVLTEDTFDPIKKQIAEDWGEVQSIGTVYMTVVKQQGEQFVITQTVVVYQNVSVTYTITFDKDMQLAGIYLK